MIKIINNFLPSDVFEEAHNLSNKVIKNPHITDPAGNHQHLLYSNYVWPDNIVHDSMPVLCHRIPISSVIFKKISEAVYNQVEMQARHILLYYWSVYSYIPWHDDGHQHAGLTIYLNKKWDRDDGGLFLYNEGDGIRGVVPSPNLGVFQNSGILHSTTPVLPRGKLRQTIQVWFNEK